MGSLFHFVFLLLVASTIARVRYGEIFPSFGPELDCRGLVDGYYPNPYNHHSYYRCVKFVSYPFKCPAPFVFNPHRVRCHGLPHYYHNHPYFYHGSNVHAFPPAQTATKHAEKDLKSVHAIGGKTTTAEFIEPVLEATAHTTDMISKFVDDLVKFHKQLMKTKSNKLKNDSSTDTTTTESTDVSKSTSTTTENHIMSTSTTKKPGKHIKSIATTTTTESPSGSTTATKEPKDDIKSTSGTRKSENDSMSTSTTTEPDDDIESTSATHAFEATTPKTVKHSKKLKSTTTTQATDDIESTSTTDSTNVKGSMSTTTEDVDIETSSSTTEETTSEPSD